MVAEVTVPFTFREKNGFRLLLIDPETYAAFDQKNRDGRSLLKKIIRQSVTKLDLMFYYKADEQSIKNNNNLL